MAATEQQKAPLTAARIVACFTPGSAGAPRAIADLAKTMQAELLGLFIEDVELLRFAALPFAVEVGFPSAARRTLDPIAMERSLRAQAIALRQTLALALEPASVSWTFRIERASLPEAIKAALSDHPAPVLLIPPNADLGAQPRVLRRQELEADTLRALIAAGQPALIVPE